MARRTSLDHRLARLLKDFEVSRRRFEQDVERHESHYDRWRMSEVRLEQWRRTIENMRRQLAQLQNSPEFKARKLLYEHLSPKQRQDLEVHGWFEVRGSKWGRYRLHDRNHGTGFVQRVKFGKPVNQWYCIHTDRYLPLGDELLAMKLAIENHEIHFRATAHRYHLNH